MRSRWSTARRSCWAASPFPCTPAGHILGSAQVRLEHGGELWVVSGDYKRQSDPTCAPFQPLECDVFVSESTFGQPHFVWPETAGVIGNIVRWWQINRERGKNSVLFCYGPGQSATGTR